MLLMTRRAFDPFILLQVPPAKSAMEQPQVRLNKAMKMKTSAMSQERHKVCMCIDVGVGNRQSSRLAEDCKQSEYVRGFGLRFWAMMRQLFGPGSTTKAQRNCDFDSAKGLNGG